MPPEAVHNRDLGEHPDGRSMGEELPADSQGKLIVFGASQIRRAWLDGQWFFSVVDIIGALTESASPPKYWDAMKRREKDASGVDLSTFCREVRLTGADGKSYRSEAVNTESAFRIIQSTSSPKAEPFKRWLAEVGYQRVREHSLNSSVQC
jgi:prophage antirepressor-like protein